MTRRVATAAGRLGLGLVPPAAICPIRRMVTVAVALLAIMASVRASAEPWPDGPAPFPDRGYYLTFMRMPTYDLAAWRRIVDGIQADGGNLLILWIGGAFASQQFPITWRYNAEHANVRHDFVRELIDHAHQRGVRVLLGFTPFGYDGVNQYALEHPELRAIGPDGQPVRAFGIGCWGYNLCPSQPESQRFLRAYTRELLDIYPDADGLLIESSDYAICHCADCGPRYFEREFGFVKQLSDELWRRKPDAMIVVYPHYFTGADVPGFGVKAARQPFDPRWTLFFTPHSAHLDADLIRQARRSLWWDDAPALKTPRVIQASLQRARAAGVTGITPSLEAFSFVATEAEEGQAWLKGRRMVPFGLGWLAPGEPPYDELPVRVQRLACRAFGRDPDLPFDEFRDLLGRELFGDASTAQAIDDALSLQELLALERTWCQPAPLASPERVRAMHEQGTLTAARRASYRQGLDRLQAIEQRWQGATPPGLRDLHQISRWMLDRWSDPANRRLLDD